MSTSIAPAQITIGTYVVGKKVGQYIRGYVTEVRMFTRTLGGEEFTAFEFVVRTSRYTNRTEVLTSYQLVKVGRIK